MSLAGPAANAAKCGPANESSPSCLSIASSCATCQTTALSNHLHVSPTRGLSIARISRLHSLPESVAEGEDIRKYVLSTCLDARV